MQRYHLATVQHGHLSAYRLPTMFMVSEEDAAANRTIFEQEGEWSAAIELRRRFPGIADNARARECVRTIAGWRVPPLPAYRCRTSSERLANRPVLRIDVPPVVNRMAPDGRGSTWAVRR
jgi:hypothetical protein